MIKAIIYLLTSITIFAPAVIGPAMGELYLYFNEESPLLIRSILTTTSLFVIPASFLSVYMCKYLGKKKVLLIALLIYAIFGALSGALSNIYAILVCRAILGIGVGLLMPISQALPIYFFTGTERAEVVTRQSASVSMGNMVCVLIAGLLATISWRLTFCVYAVALPALLIVYFYLPELEEKEEVQQVTHEKIPFSAYCIILLLFIVILIMFVFYANLAILMQVRGIGNSATAGYMLSICAFTSFLTSFNLQRIHKKLKTFLAPSLLLAASMGYCLLYFSSNFAMIFIAGLCVAYSMGTVMPLSTMELINRVPKSVAVKTMAYSSTAMFLGQFLSPILFEFLPHIPNHDEYGAGFLTSSVLLFTFFMLALAYTLFQKKNTTEN